MSARPAARSRRRMGVVEINVIYYTKIFCEVEYEGETYSELSEDGADALADYFLGLMEQIDEQRSNDAELNRRKAMDAVLADMESEPGLF